MMNKGRNSTGFTVVELIISLTVATIMISVLFSITFTYFTNARQSQEAAFLAIESQTLLSQMTEDLRLAEGVGLNNSLPDAHAPAGGWLTNSTNKTLIIRTPVVNASQDIMYRTDTGDPYENEYIYFVQDDILFKRTLKNSVAPQNSASATCPVSYETSTCSADRVFSRNVRDLDFVMYDIDNTVVTDPSQAQSLEITVTLAKDVFGKTVSISNTTQITQRNR